MTRGLGALPVRIEFRPGEWWFGVRVTREGFLVDVWVAVLPMFPVHVWFLRKWKGDPSTEAAGGYQVYPRPKEAVRDSA